MSLKPGSMENLPSLAVDATGATSFPVGPCLLASHCFAPTHEVRKKCPGCGKYIHALCGRVLEEDEGLFPADSVVFWVAIQRTRVELLSSLPWKLLMSTRKLKRHLPTCQQLMLVDHMVVSGLYSPVQILPATRSFIVYALSIS